MVLILTPRVVDASRSVVVARKDHCVRAMGVDIVATCSSHGVGRQDHTVGILANKSFLDGVSASKDLFVIRLLRGALIHYAGELRIQHALAQSVSVGQFTIVASRI